jgi:hypothetical protein
VPSVVPITAFEQAWVLSTLLATGMYVTVFALFIEGMLHAVTGPGTGGAPGLPPDCDTTGATLTALMILGIPATPDVLRSFETETHFQCWAGERTASPTANAHVLEALGAHLHRRPDRQPQLRASRDKAASWLRDAQQADGSWCDKWHASPYYATACCALALHHYGGKAAVPVLAKAITWIEETQRPDGSWGVWGPTAEETSYALRTLMAVRPDSGSTLVRGATALIRLAGKADYPPLWHDKDLYAPQAVIDASVVAALYMVYTRVDLG